MEMIDHKERLDELADAMPKMSKSIYDAECKLAKANAEYERDLAKKMLELRESGTQTTLLDKIAKGELYQQRYTIDVLTAQVKKLCNDLVNARAISTNVQTQLKHFSE